MCYFHLHTCQNRRVEPAHKNPDCFDRNTTVLHSAPTERHYFTARTLACSVSGSSHLYKNFGLLAKLRVLLLFYLLNFGPSAMVLELSTKHYYMMLLTICKRNNCQGDFQSFRGMAVRPPLIGSEKAGRRPPLIIACRKLVVWLPPCRMMVITKSKCGL
jgi:hypothetical protein